MTLGTGIGNTNKVSAILLASVLLFSTVSISSLAGMTPLPNAYAGGGGFDFAGVQCNIEPIPSDDEGEGTAMTFFKSEGVFLWASFDELFRLTVDGDKTSIGNMDHDSKGLAFSLDGNTLFSIERRNDELHIVDPSDASTVDTKTITLSGKTVRGGNGLATHPTTGELLAILKITGQSGRELVTINPSDGVATSIGNTGLRINGLAFTAGGQLFATTGSGADINNSVFAVNTSNANVTFLCTFSNRGGSGASIALNSNDNTLYISALDSRFFKFLGGTLTTCATEKITNNINRQITGMTFWESEGVFLIAQFNLLFELTLDAVETFIGSIRVPSSFSQSSKGLAFSLDGNTLFSIDRGDDELHVVDQTDASIDSTKTITLSGETVNGGTGLATHPSTGELWAILKISGQDGRELVTINPSDGVATSKGDTGLEIASIAFDSSGTLFGVTGERAAPSETLITISQTDGTPTIVCGLGSGENGEVIAFNPNDGFLYHMSGSGTIFEKIVGFSGVPTITGLALFSIDKFEPLIHAIDPITGNVIKSSVINYEFALDGGNALATDSSNQMFAVLDPRDGEGEDRRLVTINPTTAQAIDIGPLDNRIIALAFNDGILFGLTDHRNSGPVGVGWLVSINTNTAEVTPICQIDPTARQMHIANNPTDNLLYFFASGELRGKIVDIENCTIEAPGEGGNLLDFIFEYVPYTIISMILPSAEAGNGGECFNDSDVNTRAATFWEAESTFLAAGECFGTIDPDTGDKALINDLEHRSKGLAFATIGSTGGGGISEPPTIGMDMAGRVLIVTCGVAFDGVCFTITSPFHEEFKLYEMMSGTHTISITMYCTSGVTTCNYAAIGIMPYSESMDNTTWKIELYKDFEGNLTIVKTDPEGFTGTTTVTTQIVDDKFWVVSFTIDFKNKDTGPMMFGVQVRDNYNAVRNWYLNEGVEFIDSDAYPSIETEFQNPLEIDSLCLNEDPTYRYSCAFEKIRERAIQIAEETLRQIMNN